MRVWVTSPALKFLTPYFRRHRVAVEFRRSREPVTPQEWRRKIKRFQAVITLLTDRLNASRLREAAHLKIIANYAVGYDNIDIATARRLGIVVTNTPKVLYGAVAEHTITLTMALARRIVEADEFTRAGKYKGWQPDLFLGTDLSGKTMGIVGMGNIGQGVAWRAMYGLEMRVIYSDPRPNKEIERKLHIRRVSFRQLLRVADVVTLHVPLLPSTYHLINKQALRLMKKSAFLINTSRGPVVEEKALVEALRRGGIAGAALDVFEHEPRVSKVLCRMPNVILTPHIASATREAREGMGMLAARNVVAVLRGRPPLTPVS